MTYGGRDTRRDSGLVHFFALMLEQLGLLNKGSADAPAAPKPDDVSKLQPISSNALNVTRVSGLGAAIASAGAAALAIFDVQKGRDATAIVVAAYASVGLIVAAALITVAIIIAADIRARQAIAVATSKAPPPTERIDVKTLDGVTQTEVTLDHVAADGGGS